MTAAVPAKTHAVLKEIERLRYSADLHWAVPLDSVTFLDMASTRILAVFSNYAVSFPWLLILTHNECQTSGRIVGDELHTRSEV